MWNRNQARFYYLNDIMASDMRSAMFLASFLRTNGLSKNYAAYLEVIDLQKYKIIKKTIKVQQTLRERAAVPFVFIVGKN